MTRATIARRIFRARDIWRWTSLPLATMPPGTELLPPDQLKKNLEEIGIGDDSRVVYYAPDWDPMATRLFFTMDYLGHGNQAALLDGGLDQWTREKRPTSTQVSTWKPGSLTIHLHPGDRREDGLHEEAGRPSRSGTS